MSAREVPLTLRERGYELPHVRNCSGKIQFLKVRQKTGNFILSQET